MAAWVMPWFLCAFSYLCLISHGRPETSSDFTVYGNVSVLCPNVSVEEKTYELLKGDQKLHWLEYNRGRYNTSTKLLDNNELSEFHLDSGEHSYFLLSRLTANSSGLYSCHVCVVFPPPALCKSNYTEVVFVDTHPVPVEPSCPPQLEPDPTHTPFLVALGLVTLYGLLLTPITFRLWRNLKKSETYDHDYINMRQFGRRKYNGVQHPSYPQKH
ncbi:hypothetical protein ACEWY4_016432 [Coilia grayii]|uniref:Uncharacterized protein n=1 Tax=Coilia grayii TaxID=363190 RepID=A0ABD1JKB6_9TELE